MFATTGDSGLPYGCTFFLLVESAVLYKVCGYHTHRCSSLLTGSTGTERERVVLLSLASWSSSLLPITSNTSAIGILVKGEVTSKLTSVLPSSSFSYHAVSTKSPECWMNVGDLPVSGESMRVRNFTKLYVGESMLDTMTLRATWLVYFG